MGLLIDKLSYNKILRVYLSKRLFKIGSAKPKVVRSTPAGAEGKTFTGQIQKQSKEMV